MRKNDAFQWYLYTIGCQYNYCFTNKWYLPAWSASSYPYHCKILLLRGRCFSCRALQDVSCRS